MTRWSEMTDDQRRQHSAACVRRRRERIAAMTDDELARYKDRVSENNRRYYQKTKAGRMTQYGGGLYLTRNQLARIAALLIREKTDDV